MSPEFYEDENQMSSNNLDRQNDYNIKVILDHPNNVADSFQSKIIEEQPKVENPQIQNLQAFLSALYSKIEFIELTCNSNLLFKADNKALIVRSTSPFFDSNLELKRRQDSVSAGVTANLKGVDIGTRHDLYMIDGKPYIVKEVHWIEGLLPISTLSLESLSSDRSYLGDLVSTYSFLLKALLTQGKLYDFIIGSMGSSKVHQKLLSDNIFYYLDDKGNRSLFLDIDWYIKLSDYQITGFPKSSYYKRFAIGAVKFAAILIYLSVSKTILNIKSKFR